VLAHAKRGHEVDGKRVGRSFAQKWGELLVPRCPNLVPFIPAFVPVPAGLVPTSTPLVPTRPAIRLVLASPADRFCRAYSVRTWPATWLLGTPFHCPPGTCGKMGVVCPGPVLLATSRSVLPRRTIASGFAKKLHVGIFSLSFCRRATFQIGVRNPRNDLPLKPYTK